MSSQAEQPSLVVTRRLANGAVEWIPLKVPQHMAAAPGADYTLIDRADYEAPQQMVAERQGNDLVVEVQGNQVLVLDGFFTAQDAAFYPTTDIAGGAGPFSGTPVTPDTPVVAGSPAGEHVVWEAEGAESGRSRWTRAGCPGRDTGRRDRQLGSDLGRGGARRAGPGRRRGRRWRKWRRQQRWRRRWRRRHPSSGGYPTAGHHLP